MLSGLEVTAAGARPGEGGYFGGGNGGLEVVEPLKADRTFRRIA
jgi:hypothetical protein